MSESRLRKDIVDAELIALYQSGMSIRRIAATLGFNRATIWWRLRNSGTKLRAVGFPPKKIGEPPSQILPLATQ